ncbi:TraI/MobA(P) family conjugative relaxase [Azotobacter chroococcum]|uniref:Conjugal transfer relaxase TraI n=1 Tax=Azotobacter chroococcum NCIMB 8003 TaxID=1328314 RepID=A0A0C4WL02_9GAMM|nr:TraI/MobA(P) family conjugative relaxase [Azotobacter chroococcum]AJE23498.1 Conjugal transfer relaxase TraI [Azotobacter chroococcum NCIMB 8003]
MISKRIPMNSAKKSSFAGLVNYITNSQGISERVGEVRITNCQSESVTWAVRDILSAQQKNTRAEGDKTYHLLISFAPGEKPSAEVLRDVEDRICAAMGYGEHQRISAVHNDTDVLHIHVAINKIHPQRLTMHEPYRDFKTRAEICAKLEIEHGLERVNHTGRKSLSESKANDMERHAGVESLLSWVRRECLEQIQNATSWKEMHQVLHEHGLELRKRGNGLVIADHEGTMVKASTVARDLSKNKLEDRLGEFEGRQHGRPTPSPGTPLPKPGIGKVGRRPPPASRNRLRSMSSLQSLKIDSGKRYEKRPVGHRTDTTELYARYKDEQSAVRHTRAKELAAERDRRDRALENARRAADLKRASIKLMVAPGLNKKLLYASTHKTLKEQIAKIQTEHRKAVEKINTTRKARQWADWLQVKAKEGDQEALKALRARAGVKGLQGDAIAAKGPQKPSQAVLAGQDHITKEGTVIYLAGAAAIRDDGSKLQVSRGTTFDGIETALRMAVARYGKQVTVTGSPQFKELVAQTAAVRNLPIKFDDPALEQRRQALQQAIEKERNNVRADRGRAAGTSAGGNGFDPARRGRSDTGRTTGAADGQGDGVRGSATGTGVPERLGAVDGGRIPVRALGGTAKPGVARVGRKPPPESQNRLRALSQLGVVQLTHGAEVLLPRHVPGDVEHQGAKPTDGLRRDVSRPGVAAPTSPISGQQAARIYIEEREEKRAKGFDIPKHRLYNQADDGAASFEGVRQVKGQFMALLKRGDDVLVLPINEATARRMKRMKLGDPVRATAKGAIKSKGKSR